MQSNAPSQPPPPLRTQRLSPHWPPPIIPNSHSQSLLTHHNTFTTPHSHCCQYCTPTAYTLRTFMTPHTSLSPHTSTSSHGCCQGQHNIAATLRNQRPNLPCRPSHTATASHTHMLPMEHVALWLHTPHNMSGCKTATDWSIGATPHFPLLPPHASTATLPHTQNITLHHAIPITSHKSRLPNHCNTKPSHPQAHTN